MPKSRVCLPIGLLIACLALTACSVGEPAAPAVPGEVAAAAVKDDAVLQDLTPELLAKLNRAFTIQQWEELVFTLTPPHYSQQLSPPLWLESYPVSACIPLGETTDLGGEVFTVKVRIPVYGSIPTHPEGIEDAVLFEIEGLPPDGEVLRIGLSPMPWNWTEGDYWVFQLIDLGQGFVPGYLQMHAVGPIPWLRPQFTVDIPATRNPISRGSGLPDKP